MLGFQWWLFEDWPGVHNGLVDYGTLEPKGNALSAQQIGKFVAPVVVLPSREFALCHCARDRGGRERRGCESVATSRIKSASGTLG